MQPGICVGYPTVKCVYQQALPPQHSTAAHDRHMPDRLDDCVNFFADVTAKCRNVSSALRATITVKSLHNVRDSISDGSAISVWRTCC